MSAIEEARAMMEGRLADLNDEKDKIERAIKELGGKVRKAPGRKPAAAASSSGTPKRRKRRGGTRLDQAVDLITKEPGISASDVAKKMKIKPNYLYRVLGEAEKEGRVKKDGRNYFPKEAAPAK